MSATARRVVVLGDVMTDVVVEPTAPFAPGSDTPSVIRFSPGGSAATQAVWLARTGALVDFVGVVGDDAEGEAAARALRAAGVRPHLRRTSNSTTGVVVALVGPGGERSMLTDRGANLELDASVLPGECFVEGAHFHLSGYSLFDARTRPAALAAWALAGVRAMTRSIDPCSAAPLKAAGPAAFLDWTSGADFCCTSLAEARVLAAVTGGGGSPASLAAALRAHYREVAITLGPDGVVWCGDDALELPALAAEVVDTTGAGDAFGGTFLGRRLAGDGPETALRAGLEAAAAAVARRGARDWTA